MQAALHCTATGKKRLLYWGQLRGQTERFVRCPYLMHHHAKVSPLPGLVLGLVLQADNRRHTIT